MEFRTKTREKLNLLVIVGLIRKMEGKSTEEL